MPVSSHDRRSLLRLALGLAALWAACERADAAMEVTAPVEQLHAGLMAIMKAGKTASFRQRYEMIAPIIGRTFDLDTILRQTIGARWTALPAHQQTSLEDAFQRYTIASYVANFEGYSDERFEIAPRRECEFCRLSAGGRRIRTSSSWIRSSIFIPPRRHSSFSTNSRNASGTEREAPNATEA